MSDLKDVVAVSKRVTASLILVSSAEVRRRDEPSRRLTNSPAVPLISDWKVLVAVSREPATELTVCSMWP